MEDSSKRMIITFFTFLALIVSSCNAQRMMRILSDAKQLQKNKTNFIGKPFTSLLDQIEPEIKFVYGEPDNKYANSVGGTYIKLFFITKADVKSRFNKNKKPTGITVRFNFDPKNTRKPIPVGGISISKEELKREYGNMIIQNIYVSGEN